ncbi:GNAT family N-acetyltransferase [Maribacter algicola]|uniref:GNAT family N-acetyltransferase n=1 Tax=Meishania litoralis TaxID=3434685 RepID=A0ACC7LJQ3_9FLAO
MTISILTKDQVDESLQTSITALYNQLNSNLKQLPLKQLVEDGDSLVFAICKSEGQVAGIALMATYKVISGHKGMIEDVVVDVKHRGQGIGRKLMEKLLESAKNKKLDEVLLFSGHHRTPAINLYKSLGFQLKDSGLYRLILN